MGKLATAARAQAEATSRNGEMCGVAVALERLSEEDGEDLRSLLSDKAVPCTIIREQMRSVLEYSIGADTLRRHRRTLLGGVNGCQCQAPA